MIRKYLCIALLLAITICGQILADDNSFSNNVIQTYTSDSKFPYTLKITRSYPENLLQNGDFGIISKGQIVPEKWFDINPLNTKAVNYFVKTDTVDSRKHVQITSTEDAPAYIGQAMKVEEGKRYYCSVYSKFDGSCEFLLRVYTDQYADSGSWADKSSNTEVRDTANPGQGEGLEDFIDPQFLNPVSKDRWAKRELEFTVPAGHNIDTYYFTCGIYGYGWTDISYAYAAPAEYSLTLEISGKDMKKVRIAGLNGVSIYESDPDSQTANTIKIVMPTRLVHYNLEITDTQGNKYRRSIQ